MRVKTFGRALSALLLLLLPLLGCTKEKAEALKNAAQQFQNEASLAIAQVRLLLQESATLPSTSVAEMSADLSAVDPIDEQQLQELMMEAKGIGASDASKQLESQLEAVERPYLLLGQVFNSLPEGRLLVGDAVKKSEAHALRLTVQMVHLASFVEKQPQLFLGRRASLIARINQAKALQDEKARAALLQSLAGEIESLAKEESAARDQAVAQCLKAAQAGKTLSNLIKEYDALTVADILSVAGESLQTARAMGFQGRDLTVLLKHYQQEMETIQKDPYWAPILNMAATP